MTYNAGDIEASATLNRDPFIEGLKQCQREGDAFARQRFTATADIDSRGMRRAMADLEAYRALQQRVRDEGTTGDRGRVRASQTQARIDQAAERAAFDRWRGEQQILLQRQRLEQQASLAQRRLDQQAQQSSARLIAQQARYDQARARSSTSSHRAAEQDKHDFNLMRTAIEQLGPPLIPLAGGIAGLAAGVGVLGLAGVLAFKGIQAQMKAGTPLGIQYAGMFGAVTSTVHTLQATTARGLAPGIDQSITKLHGALPQLNVLLGTSSHLLGDTAQHLVGGLVAGFQTFEPLIVRAEGYVDKLAGRFESWSSGPGGHSFAQTLSTDFEHAIPALEAIGTLAVHLLSAFNGPGLTALDVITRMTAALDKLPVGVIEAAATAYLAFRTVVAVTTGIDAATAAIARLTGAEEASAVASRGAAAAGAAGPAGGAGARAGRLARYGAFAGKAIGTAALLEIGGQYAGSAAANSGWLSPGTLAAGAGGASPAALGKYALAKTGQVFGDVASLNLGGAYSDLFGANQHRAQGAVREFSDYQTIARQLGLTRAGGSSAPPPGTFSGGVAGGGSDFNTARQIYGQQTEGRGNLLTSGVGSVYGQVEKGGNGPSLAAQTRQAYAHDYGAITHPLGQQQQQLQSQLGSSSNLSSLSDAYDKVDTSLQRTVNTQRKWLNQGGDAIFKYHGVTVGQNTYAAALRASNGDHAKAVGLIQAQVDAMNHTQHLLGTNSAGQQRLNADVAAAAAKYGLTADQVNEYTALLGINGKQLADGTISQKQYLAAIGQVADAVKNGNTAVAGWTAALAQFEQGEDTAASRGQLLAAAMVSLNGPTLNYANVGAQAAVANQQFVDSFRAAKAGVVNLKTGFIDFHNAGSAPLLSSLAQLQTSAANFAAVTYQDEVSTRGRTQAAKDAAAVYYNDTHGALEAEASQLGITKQQADHLADRYFHWPKNATTQIIALGAKGTNILLNAIGQQLSFLTKHPWNPTVDVNDQATPTVRFIEQQLSELPTYKSITIGVNHVNVGPGSSTYNSQVPGARGMMFVGDVRRYAQGGLEDHTPAIYPPAGPGRVRVFAEPETQGEAYIPLANDGRRPRAKEILAATAHLLGGVVSFFASGGGPGEQGGFTGVSGGGGSHGGGGSSSGGGGGHSSGSSHPAAHARKLGHDFSATIRTVAHDLDLFGKLAKATASKISSVEASVLNAARVAAQYHAVPSSLVRTIKAETVALDAEVKRRDATAAALAKSNAKVAGIKANIAAERKTVADTVLGTFDAGTSGNGYAAGIKSSLSTAVADAQKFLKYRQQALALGLSPALLRQITEEGPTQAGANLEAIVKAGKGYVAGLNADYGKLNSAAQTLGQNQGTDIYGKQLAAAAAQAKRDAAAARAEQRKTTAEVKSLQHAVETLERRLQAAQRQR